MAASYRLPRRYRYPRYRRSASGAEVAAGVGIAAAVIVAVTHPHATTGPLGHAGESLSRPSAAAPVTSGSETAFFTAVLTDLGAPGTRADLRSLEAWYPHEYPSWPPGARYNPLDTILAEPGSWAFNTFSGGLHVQSYPSAAEGAEATARTLERGYPAIVAALRSGGGLCGRSLAGEFLTWSGNGYSGVC